MLRLLNPIPTYHRSTPTKPPFLHQLRFSKQTATACQTATASATSSPPQINSRSSSFSWYGFSAAQTETIIHKNPWVLTTKPEKTIKPKLDHLLAYGYSPDQLIQLICHDPCLLSASLTSRIGPNLCLLEGLLGSKLLVIKVCHRGPWLLRNDLEKTAVPIVDELKVFGVPNDRIVRLFVNHPLVMSQPVCVITETLYKLKALGMNPESMTFIYGITAMVATKKSTWKRKMQIYKSFGWSEEDVLSAFARQPTCMLLSDDKIKRVMRFFMDTLNWNPAVIVRRVALLTLSLEKRIIPRCAVMEVLVQKGLWDGKPGVYTLLCISEKRFEERFVENYKEKVPSLQEAYQGKMEFSGFALAKLRREKRYPSNGTLKSST